MQHYATRSLVALTALMATGCSTGGPATPVSTPSPHSLSAAICPPAPNSHQPITNPTRHFSAPPGQVLDSKRGYCAYIATARGVVSVRLRPEIAPKAVNNFVFLATHGFYDGLPFYRVCPDAGNPACPSQAPIAVTGSPDGSSAGGPGYALPAEPVTGEYLLGTMAMYGSDPKTIGSQFAISLGDGRSLPHTYVIFGQATDGFTALVGLKKGDTVLWVDIESTEPVPGS